MDRIAVVVRESEPAVRLDRFLAGRPEVGTRSQAKRLIDGGLVCVDGVRRKGGCLVRPGMRVEFACPVAEVSPIEGEPIPLTVLYEDADVLAIDKPAGMVVHPAPGARRGTLVHALLHRLGTLSGVGAPDRPGIVHRLDRDTSGVLLVARTVTALEGLARQFRERTVEKRYLAVVHGRLEPTTGHIDRPIGRDPRERKRMSVRGRRGRSAVTRWRVVERLERATLVRLAPETGRTHQLRVHLASVGHPIVGDRVYGIRRRSGAGISAPRQALHAEEIGFRHPVTDVPLRVRASMPPDLEALLRSLRQGGDAKGKSPISA